MKVGKLVDIKGARETQGKNGEDEGKIISMKPDDTY